MKNNTNKLIFEELKKASLLFNYNPEKTLSENIMEQEKGPVVYQDEDNSLNPDIVAKAEQMVAASTKNGQNPSPADFSKMFQSLSKQFGGETNMPSPEEFSKKLQSMTNKSPEEMSKMFQSMIAGVTQPSASGTTSGTTSGTIGTSSGITTGITTGITSFLLFL